MAEIEYMTTQRNSLIVRSRIHDGRHVAVREADTGEPVIINLRKFASAVEARSVVDPILSTIRKLEGI